MYVPVLKNRTVEMSVLSQLARRGVFDNSNILPLVELIQERTRTNNKNTIIDDLFPAPDMPVTITNFTRILQSS